MTILRQKRRQTENTKCSALCRKDSDVNVEMQSMGLTSTTLNVSFLIQPLPHYSWVSDTSSLDLSDYVGSCRLNRLLMISLHGWKKRLN